MSPSWTRRRPLTPPDSGAPVARLAVALAALLLVAASAPACGRSKNENRIKPIVATLTIQNPYQGAPDPAVYLFKDPKDSRFPDLETVEVRLRATSPVSFDAFTLEFTYNFLVIQVGDVFDVNPAVLGDCNGGSSCQPLCQTNAAAANSGLTVDNQGMAHFLMGVAATSACPPAKTGRCSQTKTTPCVLDTDCPTGETCIAVPDTTLVTLAFIAATVIDPSGTPIKLISGARHGDCEILNALADQGIPCVGGDATMTTSR